MKNIYLQIKILIIFLFLCTNAIAKESNFFEEGIKLYDKKKFDESKILFERDLVYNPKSEKAYLYLAKIFKKRDNDVEQEINLNNVLLLNPQNEEAIYMLALLRIKQSDYDGAKRLIERFDLFCDSFCSKKTEIKNKFDKLTPENGKDKN